MTKIGVQGIEGSFSEQAAETFAQKNKINDYTLSYLVSSENVLNAVENGDCDYGIFALENSTGGVVFETINAIAKYRCHIFEYFSIKVVQNLLALPDTDRTNIDEIYSHQQALRQCRQYLTNNYPNAKQIEADDTALSAQQLKEGVLPAHAAVIANKKCADLFGLTLLEEDINDLKDNQTLFIAATKLEDNA